MLNGIMHGKVVLITGAGSGIGRQSAITFAREGGKVIVTDIAAKAGEETVRLVHQSGGSANFLRLDVSKEAEVKNVVQQIVERYGRLDVAYNNAGIENKRASIVDSTEDDWDRVMTTNLKGVWLCLKHEISFMVKQRTGAIVNACSVVGLIGQRDMASYVAAKHGVLGLTKVAALEYASAGIRVNAVCPAIVNTSMLERYTQGDSNLAVSLTSTYPINRLIEPQEVAEAVLWLSSDRASYLNGHALVMDGGLSVQ